MANLSTRTEKPGRILHRIVFPFIILFTVITIAYWLISSYFVGHYLENTFRQRMEQVTKVISKSDFVLNQNILLQLKSVIDADLILFTEKGELLRSTFSESENRFEFKRILPNESGAGTFFTARDVTLGGREYRAVFHGLTLPGGNRGILSLWVSKDIHEQLKRNIFFGMGAIAFLGICTMACAGYFIARTITAPIESLVSLTRSISSGDLTQRAGIGKDEIGTLAESFNEMLEKLTDYEKRLVESEKLAAVGRMAASLTHEIRNPLTSIRMLAQVIHGRLSHQEESRKMLQALMAEIDRLDRIIQEVVDRSRPKELVLEPSDLNGEVEKVMALAVGSLNSRKVKVLFTPATDLPEVMLDRGKIEQVLWNLILNAQEAMPKGGNLSISTASLEGERAAVVVKNSGTGLPAGDVERFFQPFFTTKPEGMGLGLTISRRIVEEHGGTLTLESVESGVIARMVMPVAGNAPRESKEEHGASPGG